MESCHATKLVPHLLLVTREVLEAADLADLVAKNVVPVGDLDVDQALDAVPMTGRAENADRVVLEGLVTIEVPLLPIIMASRPSSGTCCRHSYGMKSR